ncbi:hypothetical protein KM043_007126 [Ampulex compressa]|nr:hypothetical protein KM043_007126 [Ampulex compressa]
MARASRCEINWQCWFHQDRRGTSKKRKEVGSVCSHRFLACPRLDQPNTQFSRKQARNGFGIVVGQTFSVICNVAREEMICLRDVHLSCENLGIF